MTNSQEPEDDLYYFETDHLALRGNKDYSEVLKTLVILLSQRERAIKDYNLVVKLKKEALEDPVAVLEKITKDESIGVPDLHCVPELPIIDWSKYSVKIPKESLDSIYSDSQDTIINKKAVPSPKKESKVNQGKWTTEEQKRLEELLQVYPPEPVEMRRFQKIADALGNRTLHQVASRVQKYFVKLYKAGLPIPGRIPKSAEKYRKAPPHKHQRHNHYLFKPTTFFPELCVPVMMNDLDCVPGPSNPSSSPQPSTSSNYLMPSSSSYHQDPRENSKSQFELQLDLLRKIKQDKIRSANNGDNNQYHHLGFKCDYCSEDPIIGTRWHCLTCKNNSVDFCTDCVLSQMHSENCHPLNHNLTPFASDVDKSNNYFSDSESNSGSAFGGSSNNNVNNENVSDADDNSVFDQDVVEMISDDDDDDDDGAEEIMNEPIDSTNGLLLSNSPGPSNGNFDRNQSTSASISEDNNILIRPRDEFFCDDLESGLFTEIENVSYDYLHSGLLFDKD